MNRSVVRTLILSDWRRHWPLLVIFTVGGALGFVLLQVGGEILSILGATWFFVALIVLGCLLPPSNVVNERKKQILPFLMSLPISVTQYTTAKLLSTVGMFVVPWVTLVAAAVAFIMGRESYPDGIIPSVIIMSMLTFIGFCLIAGVTMVSESDGWMMAATVAANSSYGFGWYLLVRNEAIREGMKATAPVWGPEVVTVLAWEVAVVIVILGLTFYLQSRKRDFV
jgi:ABC-2 type transport system permease protein